MKKFFYLVSVASLLLAGCQEGFKKTSGNYEYKIIGGGSGPKVNQGEYMQIHFKNWTNVGSKDSTLEDTRDAFPQMSRFYSVYKPKEVYDIYKKLGKGDSAVVRILADTLFKKMGRELPPFIKKGKFIYTSIKVLDIFKTSAEAEAANKAAMLEAKPRIYQKQIKFIESDLASKKADIERDSKIIEAYLAKNNIKAAKTTWGTYISFQNEGTGDKVNPGSIVTVNYTGRTLDSGKVFDSNVDPAFGQGQPYEVVLSQLGSVIYGWTDALMQMKNGSKATVYIPSSLGYGTQGREPSIKPNDNLIFEMEIKSVISEDVYRAKQEEAQKKFMEEQKRVNDSLQNAAKQDSLTNSKK